ncbi:hypothetical protein, partial [Alistipes putredinis]|uniref:hypothetical protein n=1 Tax=Alistipes putredinis TaxID=28117 RepID=UPI0026DCD926
PRWLIGAFLAVLALREENALMSYGFSVPKSLCGVSAVIGSPFSFRRYDTPSIVGWSDVRPTNQLANRILTQFISLRTC